MTLFGLLTEVLSIWEDNPSFYRIENNDGKVWLMPVNKLRTAMNLYQPSGVKGKLLKRWFPVLHRLPLLKQKLHIETTRCSLADDLYDKLCRLFHTDRLEFAVFCGTPCVHQKLTIQLTIGSKILGYCKVSNHPEVAKLFEREGDFLKQLECLGFDNVPRIIFAGEWRSGIHLLVQTTCKTNHSQVVHQWGQLHEEFLQRIYTQTKRRLLFEETDYYHTLSDLNRHLDWILPEESRGIVSAAIDKVCQMNSGKMVEYGVYHADFTPWNMFVEKGTLFVFDWEYARMTYPPMLDRYHFFTQTAIFEKHWQADDIITFLQSQEGTGFSREDYTLYLLDVIARFILREKGQINGDIARSMKIWGELLKYLNQ